jgi:hypothetical protein
MRQAETITIACTKGTKAEIFIPGKPAHPTFKPFLSKQRLFFLFIFPVGLWVVCFSAFAMIDDPIIHIFLLNSPEFFYYFFIFFFTMIIQNLLKC